MGRGKKGRQVRLTVASRPPEHKQVDDLFSALRKQGVKKLKVSYFAGGEDFSVDSIKFTPALSEAKQRALQENVWEALETLLDIGAPDWKDEDGSHGTATFDVQVGTIAFDHSWVVEVVNESSERYTVPELEALEHIDPAYMEKELADLALIFTELEALGATEMTVYYNGGGDEGNLGEVEVEGTDEEYNSSLNLAQVVFMIVELNHGGWEDNRGSSGEVIFDAKEKTVRLEHSSNDVGSEPDPFAIEGFIAFEHIKVNRGPRSRRSPLAERLAG
jgi:hypothetical protein